MIDTHSHLLPGVDHGCPDMETCLLMARAAADAGVSTVVCTPHLPGYDRAFVKRVGEVLQEARGALAEAVIDLELLMGFEVDSSVVVDATDDELRELVIEGSKGAILLEMPYAGWPVYLEQSIFRLALAGFIPVLAHPERNDRVQQDSDLLVGCLRAGAVAQATAGSLGGEFGRMAIRSFHQLISEGLISLVASDAHAHRTEGWTLAPVLQALEGKLTQEEVVTLAETNPRELLAGRRPRPLVPTAPAQSRRRGTWSLKRR